MFTFKKTNHLIPLFLLLSLQAYSLSAFTFREMFEDMDYAFKNMREEFKTKFHKHQELDAEDQALINKQLEIVAKLKPEISKNENGIVTIALPIDNIDKNKIELSLEHGLLNGIIPLEKGYFKFIVHSNYITYGYLIEINKDIKQEMPATKTTSSTEAEGDKVDINQKFYWRTSNNFSESLPLEVDVTKAQSQTKNNKLFIKFEPKSYTRLKIHHA